MSIASFSSISLRLSKDKYKGGGGGGRDCNHTSSFPNITLFLLMSC